MLGIFFTYLQYEKRFSPHTLKSYSKDLEQYSEYLLTQYELSDLKEARSAMLRSWIIKQMDEGLSPRSIHRKLAAVRSYYRFLMSRGEIQVNPAAGLKKPKFEKKLPTFAPKADIDTAIEALAADQTFSGLRDRLILELLYGTGIRRAELISIQKNDFDTYRKQIKVTGKGRKERQIPLYPSLISLLEKYLLERNKLAETTEKSLLLTDQLKPCYPMFVQRKVRLFLKDIPGMTQKSPHILRHTFATHLLDNGAELQAIKELLGHSSLAATQVYTHNSIEKLKKVYEQAHPKS
jgi:integrase/recombinase XerC